MIIKDVYSHNDGEKYINDNHKKEYEVIVSAVNSVDISKVLSKVTYEKTKEPLLFSPIELNNQLKHYLSNLNWTEKMNPKSGPRCMLETTSKKTAKKPLKKTCLSK